MIVLKFGGASLADSNNYKNVAEYIKKVQDRNPIIVVSAMKGVTDLLINSIYLAEVNKYEEVIKNWKKIEEIHENVINYLIKSEKNKKILLDYLDDNLFQLKSLYKSISILGQSTEKAKDKIMSYGEKLSSKILSKLLEENSINSIQVNGEEIIVTDSNFGFASPDLDKTRHKSSNVLNNLVEKGVVPVITGFIGANEKGETTTLGRGGSDYSASIIANCLNVNAIWFLKEVDGIMSADPKIVKNAQSIQKMSYKEVAELSYFGAKVLHPIAIHPLKKNKISSYTKNVYDFDSEGTEVTDERIYNGKKVKAITSIKDVSIITIQGLGMVGKPSISGKVFGSLGTARISIIMISQSSSEQNICLVMKKSDEKKAVDVLHKALELEIMKNLIEKIEPENDVSIVSIVGEGMQNTPGISGKVFSSMGKNNINVKLIAQGSSEINISFVIETKDLEKAINAIHNEFSLGEK